MLHLEHISGELSATDRQLIDGEHERLEQFLNDLRDTCENFGADGNCHACNRSQVATCKGRLTSFFYDFLDLVSQHFDNEETIIVGHLKAADEDEYFRRHHAEHARLMAELKILMRESSLQSHQDNPSAAIRGLEHKIAEMFGTHAHAFDGPFLRIMEGKDAGG